MRVHLAADHAGYELKTHLLTWLAEHGYEPVDHGAFAYDALDDYPPFCVHAAQAVADEPGSLGIVIGGSGNGEQIAANKVEGIRAALACEAEDGLHDLYAALAGRQALGRRLARRAHAHVRLLKSKYSITILQSPASFWQLRRSDRRRSRLRRQST
jgi:RpiB/LacA/LacB family sugar-phosphate isomerase